MSAKTIVPRGEKLMYYCIEETRITRMSAKRTKKSLFLKKKSGISEKISFLSIRTRKKLVKNTYFPTCNVDHENDAILRLYWMLHFVLPCHPLKSQNGVYKRTHTYIPDPGFFPFSLPLAENSRYIKPPILACAQKDAQINISN